MLNNKNDIKAWLDKYGIEKYTIHDDMTVDVNVSVDLSYKNLTSIEVQFNNVQWDFNCSHNELISLKGCPKIVGSNFNCSHNKLNTLEYCPEIVNNSFYCHNNELISLKGCPEKISEFFNCGINKLISLEGGPNTVGRNFGCYDNQLTSLKGCPKTVGEDFICQKNPIINLNDFKCEFKGFFVHIAGFHIEAEDETPTYNNQNTDFIIELIDYYNSDNEIQLSHSELHKALLYNKLNSEINDNNSINKKLKI